MTHDNFNHATYLLLICCLCAAYLLLIECRNYTWGDFVAQLAESTSVANLGIVICQRPSFQA
jgi:hypothetical protein